MISSVAVFLDPFEDCCVVALYLWLFACFLFEVVYVIRKPFYIEVNLVEGESSAEKIELPIREHHQSPVTLQMPGVQLEV